MIAAIGTLVFLGTLWMLVVVGAALLEQSGSKICAAFQGKPRAPSLTLVPVRVRPVARQPEPIRVKAQLRAAA